MTTGVTHYLLQWWHYRVEGTLASEVLKCLYIPLPRHMEAAVWKTRPSLKKKTRCRLQGERTSSAHAHVPKERLFFLSSPPSKMVFRCDSS